MSVQHIHSGLHSRSVPLISASVEVIIIVVRKKINFMVCIQYSTVVLYYSIHCVMYYIYKLVEQIQTYVYMYLGNMYMF